MAQQQHGLTSGASRTYIHKHMARHTCSLKLSYSHHAEPPKWEHCRSLVPRNGSVLKRFMRMDVLQQFDIFVNVR